MPVRLRHLALLFVFACTPKPNDATPDAAAPPDASTPALSAAGVEVDASAAPSAAPSAPSGPMAAGQTWSGAYTCGSAKPTHLLLHIKQVNGSSVDAVFDFTTEPQKQKGQFTMHGTLSGRHLNLKFGQWIVQPPGFVPADLNGTLSDDGRGYSGSVVAPAAACKSFSVRH